MVVCVERGRNMECLNNGVKPNAFVRCNTLQFETNTAARESNPEFD